MRASSQASGRASPSFSRVFKLRCTISALLYRHVIFAHNSCMHSGLVAYYLFYKFAYAPDDLSVSYLLN
ncbi:MAG: hypothetical protein ACK41O_26870, partial [Runella zeae]